ncbi:P-loop containing nucleoside triphosphate hydrolase protein [Chytridium lagenaria]|nr:P-loop containing nucleoside triphosphate hydrolase protein [Chytridium lagenaria]
MGSSDKKGLDIDAKDVDHASADAEEEKPKNHGLNETAGPSPEVSASLLSRGVLEWLSKFMVLASKKVLAYRDVFDMEPRTMPNGSVRSSTPSFKKVAPPITTLPQKPPSQAALTRPSKKQEYANGRITNLISTDAMILERLGQVAHGVWAVPLQVIAMSIVIIVFLGYGGAAGVGFMFVKNLELEILSLKSTDHRVRLASMKIIKLFAWEDSFIRRILDIREIELRQQFKLIMLSAIFYGLTYVIPSLVAIICFSVYSVLPGNTLAPEIVFPALALINLLRVPMMEMPETLAFVVQANVTIGRIARFLAAPELEPLKELNGGPENNVALRVSNASFIWEEWTGASDVEKELGESESEPVKKPQKAFPTADSTETLVSEEVVLNASNNGKLENVDFEIEKNGLTAIVGPVGAGKSSLLQAILGEMPKKKGEVEIFGQIAYSPQQGWLLNTSLKDNILFGTPLDEARYAQVLFACALDKDIMQFPDGDMTEVGERGVTLSGGQAARVNLARSLYSRADILLLDDPLAAVDAHVGKHIFENGINGSLRKGRTVVLVTHQLHFLPNVDRILYLEDDESRFSKLMSEYGGVSDNDAPEEKSALPIATTDVKEIAVLDKDDKAPKALMVQEEREEGAVKLKHYNIYIMASGGFIMWGTAMFLALSMQGDRVLNDYWLIFWSTNQFSLSNSQYIGFYTLLGLIQGVGATILAVIVTFAGLRASRVLHELALRRITHAPMSFFDTNPMGRIVNRFSRDVADIDRWLSIVIRGSLNLWSAVLCNLVLVGYVVPAFYRNASRELKRLERLPTVRAFKSSERFIAKNQHFINVSNRPTLLRSYVDIWVAMRAEFFVAIICFAVACLGLAFRVTPALLGLSVGYTLTLTASLNLALRLVSETEARMNSVERLNYYGTEIANEAPMDLPGGKSTPANWPEHGAIVLKDVDLRYRPELPLVLKRLNASIRPGEKIGIVGRTGAGKSSVISAIYRLVELSGGSVGWIEGTKDKVVDYSADADLFQGTIRSNLDHSGIRSDNDLWEALEGASLKDFVSSLDNKLDAKVQENGENLSVGQRQLLCLARAMLVRPKILLIDEATASVDIKTDAAIQKALRVSFKESTILTVAHRLVTIIDYDRILVLKNGEVVEFDTPNTLVNQKGGIFSDLVDETGPSNAALLRKIAEEGFANIDIEKAVEQSM